MQKIEPNKNARSNYISPIDELIKSASIKINRMLTRLTIIDSTGNKRDVDVDFSQGDDYIKTAKTLLRRPLPSEMATDLITYIKDEDSELGYRIETISSIKVGSLIARNPTPIKEEEGIYNTWLTNEDSAKKAYGDEAINTLTFQFSPKQKLTPVRAIVIDDALFEKLKITGKCFHIVVDYSVIPVEVRRGDYLIMNGSTISKNDMDLTYEKVDRAKGLNL